MNTRSSTPRFRVVSVVMLTLLLVTPLGGAAVAGQEMPGVSTAITLPEGANLVIGAPAPARSETDEYPSIESRLAQAMLAARAGDRERLATFSGERHLDLTRETARVILEMDRSPEARAVGSPTVEIVNLPNGRQARIEHAPRIAIRADLEAAIAAAGATYEMAVGDLVQVSAPLAALEKLSKIADVRYVRLPFPAREDALPVAAQPRAAVGPAAPDVGTRTTEGVSLTTINTWHALGYDGTNVNLAVFDFGFTNWGTRQTNGDLPSGGNLVLKDYSASYAFGPPGTSGYDHGTACAEIAYDMAPGAKVYLYAFGTDAEFANAINDYKGAGITGKKVATMSISWVNAGPYDGTGSTSAPATKVNEAATAGIFWANSAGNYQTQHHAWTSTRYSTTDYVAFGTGNIEGIGPTSGSLWNIASGTVLRLYLEWNDWNAARTGDQNNIDYDLYLFRWTGSSWTQVASSLGNQCGASVVPTEAIAYTVPSGGPYNYGIVIARYQSGCTNNFGHWLQLFTFNGFYTAGTGAVNSFWYTNPCNSLTIPADADGAVATGATFWGEDANATYNYGLETFSSFGPRNASGGANPGTTVNKPSVVAPDGVSTATYGASNNQAYRISGSTGFWGTSAAAPHVAGMAATVWESAPLKTLDALRSYIEDQSLYKGAGGTCGGALAAAAPAAPAAAPASTTQNNRYGWGRIHLPVYPTAITLASMTAASQPDAIEVTWDTVSEVANAGFNLYRDISDAGPGVKLNEDLIPSQGSGSPEGYHYVYLDSADLAPNTTYWYWLEDVSTSGVATRHEPISVLYEGEPTAVGLAAFGGARAAGPALIGLAALAVLALAGLQRGRRSA